MEPISRGTGSSNPSPSAVSHQRTGERLKHYYTNVENGPKLCRYAPGSVRLGSIPDSACSNSGKSSALAASLSATCMKTSSDSEFLNVRSYCRALCRRYRTGSCEEPSFQPEQATLS